MNSFSTWLKIDSPYAQKYLTTLCRHFARKVPATWNENTGTVNFAMGQAKFSCSQDSLLIHCYASLPAEMEQLQAVISSHLQMFARREPVIIHWQVSGMDD